MQNGRTSIKQFLKQVSFKYLLFTSILIVGLIFGAFEITEYIFFRDASLDQLRWMYFSRGVITSLLLMIWAAWTVFKYRDIYEASLERTEKRFRQIIDSSADAILTLDNQNIIRSWNKGAEQIFGWQRDEMVGQSIETIIPQDLLDLDEIHCIELGIKQQGAITNYETERITKSGERILVQMTETPAGEELKGEKARSLIMRNITSLKLDEEQQRHSERLATIGHMAAGVAHEVGNPLTAISSITQILQRKADDTFFQQQLKKVREHINYINKIVKDLVDFSRPSNGETTDTNVQEVIEQAVGLLKHDSRCRDTQFELDFGNNTPTIQCVPDQLHQVFVNLMLNAVDAMNDQEEPHVYIRTRKEEGYFRVEVEDEGHGIPEDVQLHIFEPFYTTKEVGKGTGLGLSVSHGIIKRLGGSIDVESQPEEGTTFIIRLPLDSNN